ncbi:Accessory gene regulator protein AgrB [Dethiosulfatibacter aminovorans DSM 17477]|uniref:Accessory gene regulator protein AgrB n=1 Tax=Dethiosulfatibacter aminovorans DSM 17477 TaxID=1121476 RepID=A0A1M6JEP0_9FIRM|nr:accessory gene regulator B family protein [Dethiosulfatibacter aminovorans]SHJ45151.1 Accessory gene regulator protein AgrB [Dethiosulfatibacter aminovorans DSM 17477]
MNVDLLRDEGDEMRKTSYRIADYFIENDFADKGDYSRIVFGMEVLKTAVVQLTVVSIAGLVFGDILLALLFFIGFGFTRTFAGGFHMDTLLKCTTITLGFLLVSMFVSEYTYYFGEVHVINTLLIMVSLAVYSRFAPVENHNRSLSSDEKSKFKGQTMMIVIIMYVLIVGELLFVAEYDNYATAVNMGMTFEAFTLLPLNIGK